METKKRLNSFDKEGDSKFAIRKGNIVIPQEPKHWRTPFQTSRSLYL